MPVDITEPFASLMARLSAEKPAVEQEHNALLNERYDLSDRPAQGVTMDRTKPMQEGVRVKLPAGMTWESLAAMSPDQIRDQNLYPKGFYPLPHPKHQEGGFVFPHFLIDAIKQQDGRDLKRFDIDFDLPDHFLAEFPPAIYLTPRTDLGDVSQGKLVSLTNYYQLFNGILTPRQLEGLRLLLTPFPQQQFNATEDRRAEIPSQGAACFDCHSNGHQNGATHLAPDARPEWFRHRIKTISLRGLNIQRLFGSQRALKTVEDFTEFEQRTAYFDGDIVDRHEEGREPARARQPGRLHGRFSGDAGFSAGAQARCLRQARSRQGDRRPRCAARRSSSARANARTCHQPPYYTDNLMHDLQTERFFKPVMINNMMAVGDGPIKTFPLRGIKDNPPYLHDERLLTLEDTVEFFNLILGTKLAPQEKQDLVAFMRAL